MAGQAKVYFYVDSLTTAFGIGLQIKSLVFCDATNKIYKINVAALKGDSLNTISKTDITGGGGGTGDVVGPASAVNENIAVFDTTTGKLIKDGGKKVSELFKLDQTTPQTISNGTPKLDRTIAQITDPKHMVTKEFVESVQSAESNIIANSIFQ